MRGKGGDLFLKVYKGWKVAFAGAGVNFLVGVSYTWSIFSGELVRNLGWSQAQAALPYTIFIVTYAISMIIAGIIQDNIGPRPTITVGGIFLGGAFIISSQFMYPIPVAIIWGFLFGLGTACCFASVSPAAMKWFDAEKQGLVAGVVVGGIGLSAIIIAPIVGSLVKKGVTFAFVVCGIAMIVGILLFSRWVENPKEDNEELEAKPSKSFDIAILKSGQFYIMWLMFCLSSATGLTLATHLDSIVRVQATIEKGYLMVALFAFFNAVGRPVAGLFSDHFGRKKAMNANFILMTLTLLLGVSLSSVYGLVLVVSILGLTYGGIYSLFPSATIAKFGKRNFGFNYGLIFSAIGVAGFVPLVAGFIYDSCGDFSRVFALLAILSLLAVVLSYFFVDAVKKG